MLERLLIACDDYFREGTKIAAIHFDMPWGQQYHSKTYSLDKMGDGSMSAFCILRVAASLADSFIVKEGVSQEDIAAITADTIADNVVSGGIVLDLCMGAGGNTIRFCLKSLKASPLPASARRASMPSSTAPNGESIDVTWCLLTSHGAGRHSSRGSGPSTSPRWATRSVFDVSADCEAITDSFAFKLLRNTPLQAAAELGAWKATRELYENGHELITYTPPVIEAMVTRLPAARRGRTNYKLKYITAYIGNIAERIAKKLPPSRTTTWCPPAHTTVDDRVMHIVNSRATTRTERLQLRFNR
ncbi:unnamed protein product [Vitrella brassicaformis CCMP3155]|uniref:Trimethylguanosine synthase n=1 Tax=Vitrella brassicaformis (strain CCMP3155) TaxID=1169540 RepID=A0A0G4G5Y2_VITBC|nr:unnamed protein product [Vitrella brassicaformis CCMP3155]|eukprot:CEM23907.1 unnamed protein product [Vitrella brassicaformis CCMP3155]